MTSNLPKQRSGQPESQSAGGYGATSAGSLNRFELVGRHNPVVRAIESRSPLQVGNGRFAMALDPTGLQTWPSAYPVAPTGTLLGTQSDWGWHSMPNPDAHHLDQSLVEYDSAAGSVDYVDLSVDTHDADGQSPSDDWLRGNPHRLHLGLVGLWLGRGVEPMSLLDVEQRLDLWTGTVASRFVVGTDSYQALTAVHPERDILAYKIAGPSSGPVGISFRFPYGSEQWGDAADWNSGHSHTTEVVRDEFGWLFLRRLDDETYTIRVAGSGLELVQLARHEWRLEGQGALEFCAEFCADSCSPSSGSDVEVGADPLPSVAAVLKECREHWPAFWRSGAAVQVNRSDDERAIELERRVVLSQYLTAVNCRGDRPPAETGLMLNSWRGKFHLEMAWWHGAHFGTWNRPEPLHRMLGWYEGILGESKSTARRQNLDGARWPKQVGPHGRESPSNIGPFLIWQQPQPIVFAELLYRCSPSTQTLEHWAGLVWETAEFMASYASKGYVSPQLGPPVIPAQESYVPQRRVAKNPTFELALWKWGLDLAIGWFERLGRTVPERWVNVAASLPLPVQAQGRYMALDAEPSLVRTDHPSMLGALGLVPKTDLIDVEVMQRTFEDANADWDWSTTWGWDYPMSAMTATRLGRPDDAVASLLRDSPKNIHLPNGHNYQTPELPIYLPGNGGLLSAVALMAAGWDGGHRSAPGFGEGWIVDHEGLIRTM